MAVGVFSLMFASLILTFIQSSSSYENYGNPYENGPQYGENGEESQKYLICKMVPTGNSNNNQIIVCHMRMVTVVCHMVTVVCHMITVVCHMATADLERIIMTKIPSRRSSRI